MTLWWWLATAGATWSIAAVDPDTGEVGMAGATCGPFVWGIAGLVPGEGVVAAQYATWVHGRELGEGLLADGETPEAVLAAIQAADAKPELRQWGVVGFAGPAVGASGAEVEGELRWLGGETWSAQGNTLASAEVVDATVDGYLGADGALADRLVAGLSAGAALGGDHRCPADEAAKSAFVYVAAPEDRPREPSVELRASGSGAVARLAERFAAGRRSCATVGGLSTGSWGGLVAALALVRRRRRA